LNTYHEEEEYGENPPSIVEWEKLWRNVLIEKPKVTRWVFCSEPHRLGKRDHLAELWVGDEQG
jgi:hypothetical protein